MKPVPTRNSASRLTSTILAALLAVPATLAMAAEQRTLNNGNLVLEDIPPIPDEVVRDLNRYQNVRAASFQAWAADGQSLFVRTRFGDVGQLHQVRQPGGARAQLTFFDEPLGGIDRRPGSNHIAFTMDAGGSEFSQVFLRDPDSGDSKMLTDGESRNRAVEWDRDGKHIAYASTERNGRSNDIWIMAPERPQERRVLHRAETGSLWLPADFDASGTRLLMLEYVSVVNSRIALKDIDSGETRMLAGGDDQPSVNYPVGFDQSGDGFFFITDQGSDFARLAWAPLDDPDAMVLITADIPWNVEDMTLSDDRRRAAFTVNAGGISELYLMDTGNRRYSKVDNLPTGVVGGMGFRPDGRALALTLNTARTPSDTFVLELPRNPTRHGGLQRWTYSEVGGLNTDDFVTPELIEFTSFDGLSVPAFYYRPPGDGPFPVVISIHGGPEGQARPTFSSTYQMWLEKLGAAVLVPNVRGSDGYGREYLQMDNGYLREDSVRDIGALLDWIETQPQLDAGRVAVFGGSYGGYMVLASAVHYSDRLKAGVDIVGISNFVTFLTNTQDYRRDLRRAEYGDERIPAMREHLERISPLNHVQRIRIPMFVVQGNNDPRVPVTEAEQLVRALRNNDQSVWYMNAMNEGHGYARKENRDVYQQATLMFLRRHLAR